MYALTFLTLAVACAGVAWSVGWVASPLGYAAVSFAALGVAYAGAGPGLLLKRADGRPAGRRGGTAVQPLLRPQRPDLRRLPPTVA